MNVSKQVPYHDVFVACWTVKLATDRFAIVLIHQNKLTRMFVDGAKGENELPKNDRCLYLTTITDFSCYIVNRN